MKYRYLYLFFIVSLFIIPDDVKAAKKLSFEPPRGFFDHSFQLTITAPVENATIHYTLNGKHPLTAENVMSGSSPLTITVDPDDFANRDYAPAVCVRAIAVIADTAVSSLNTHTYIFVDKITSHSRDGQRPGAEWPHQGSSVNGQKMDYGMDPTVSNSPKYQDRIQAAMTDIPSMSMVMDLADLFDPAVGIYVNAAEHGEEWERPCSLELINPDGSDGFHINCGARIRGGWSRTDSNPKHAFRYFFRSEYGEAKLQHPLFEDEGVDEFDKMDLRTSQNYSWAYGAGSKDGGAERNTMLRDVFSRDLQRDMGQPYTRSRYYHLFINGTYWGLFQTQERSEASFAESYFGSDREDYDAIKVDAGYQRPYIMEATDGTLDAWNALWAIARNGLSDKTSFNMIQGLNVDGSPNPDYPKYVDLDNLIDFMINTLFVGDFDAPISEFRGNNSPNNFWATFNRVNPDGFKFYRHDSEHTLFNIFEDRTGPYPAGEQQEHFNPQWLHQQLTENAEYRLLFADRVYRHFYDDGALTPEANTDRLIFRKDQIDNAIIAESARWGDVLRGTPYTRDNEWLDDVNYLIEDYFPVRSEIVFDQFIDQGWYPNFDPPQFNTTSGQVNSGFQLTMTTAGGTIYYTDDGTPVYGQLSDTGTQMTTLIPWTIDKRVLVPVQDIGTAWRLQVDFDDSDWDMAGGVPGGIGYEKSSGYEQYISLDVAKYMHEEDSSNPNASCYVRIPFTLTSDDLAHISLLQAQLLYDDGFVLYLNGTKVAEAMAPSNPAWDASATDNHEAEDIETFDLSDHIDELKTGQNVLAVHGLNYSLTSSDFLMHVQLQAGYAGESSGDLISSSARKYTGTITIDKTTNIKARVLRGLQWSALNEILLSVDEDMSGLVATEIHYHPLPEGEGENEIDGDLYEFFEIKNIHSRSVNLTGARFAKGIYYEFPAGGSLNPGDFYVVCSNAVHFEQRYHFKAHGQYSGNLSNGGERVVLFSATADTILSIKYDDEPPWPIEPDSIGKSLAAKVTMPAGNPDHPDYWTASASVHGSPAADDLISHTIDDVDISHDTYQLWQNYPNPFNPATTIRFAVPQAGFVSISIYNTLGQQVEELMSQYVEAGFYRMVWNAERYSGGVYFVRMNAPDFNQTIKILFLK
ncbi:CotH kinase family protein [candidate division KSB1 bacterium]|nr:CotH kinase family protein [candidate division KSB1 bacterium]